MKSTSYLIRSYGLFILSCLTIYLSSCTPSIVLYGDLSGTVTDDVDSDPIHGALIETLSGNQSALTDSSGNYEIRNLEADNHIIRASADGYITFENYKTITESAQNQLDFSMERKGKIFIEEDSLEFGLDSVSLTFSLANTGKSQMSYSIIPSNQWISIDPAAGFIDASSDVTVTVTINREETGYSTVEGYIQVNSLTEQIALDLFVNRVMDMDTNFYKVVEIGGQIWMAENLNVGTRINANPPYIGFSDIPAEVLMSPTDGVINKYCYENEESNCDEYGGLYQWFEAMQWWEYGEPSPIGPTQGICPDGWHIPTLNDWMSLIDFLGGEEIAASKLTEGTSDCINDGPSPNESGFSALLGGYLWMFAGPVGWTGKDLTEQHWLDYRVEGTYTFAGTTLIGCRVNFDPVPLGHFNVFSRDMAFGLPVRCIKDP